MKIALVHDYLREYGGAERVVEVMHEMWPAAPLYTSFVDWKSLGDHAKRFAGWDIRTSWVQNNPIVKKFHSPLRFLAPMIWGSFELSDYDVVISSSGWFMSRGVRAGAGPHEGFERQGRSFQGRALRRQLHVCYIHHPPRNLYGYATGSSLQKYWPVRAYASIINFFLRHYDFETAQRVDYFIANSRETARRVMKFYRRESTVIYPPVGITKGPALDARQGRPLKKEKYFLSVGRLTYSKRVDLAILAANKLKFPLKIIGAGKEEASLRTIAGPTVEFAGAVSDEQLDELYSGAKALIFTALDEDFGMVPVEAMAHGIPVIALGQGGVLETVVDARSASSGQGATGVLFHEPTVESLTKAIYQFTKLPIYQSSCVAQAKKFSKNRFKKELKAFVEEKYSQRAPSSQTGKK